MLSHSRSFRLIAILTAFTQLASVGLAGTVELSSSAAKGLKEIVGQMFGPPRAPHFSGVPGPVYLGPNPGRSEGYQRGWTPQTMRLAKEAIARRNARFISSWQASIEPILIQSSEDEGGGFPTNGQGGGPGEGPGGHPGGSTQGGSSTPSAIAGGVPYGVTNSLTGNKLTEIPIAAFPSRGDVGISLSLIHNSKTSVASEFGEGWSHSYNFWIDNGGGTSKIVHFPDGLLLLFTLNPTGSKYTSIYSRYGSLFAISGGYEFKTPSQMKYVFDSNGDLTSIVDRAGNTVTVSRDTSGKITSVQEVVGTGSRQITFSYTGNNITEITCPDNRQFDISYATEGGIDTITYPTVNSQTYTTIFDYDSFDNITKITDQRGKDWLFTYNTGDQLTSEKYPQTGTSPPPNETVYVYNTNSTEIRLPLHTTSVAQKYVHNYTSGLLATEVDPGGFSTAYEYDAYMIDKITDKRGKIWEYTYDAAGNMLTSKDPLTNTWTYTYNSTNDLLTTKAPGQTQTTTIARTSIGKVDTVTDTLSRTLVDYTYDSYGQVISAKDAYNRETTYAYEADGDLQSVSSPSSGTTEYTYDTYGRLTSSENAIAAVTSVEYDEWGRPERVLHPAIGSTVDDIEASYDPTGNVLTVTDERGEITTMTYDNAGLLSTVTNALGDQEVYSYNGNQWLTSVKNGRNYTRTYEHNIRGEVVKLTIPDGTIEQWTYDNNGNTDKYTSPHSGGAAYDIDYVYDNAGRLTTIDYDTGTDTTFTYDALGRREQMVDSTGTTEWDYNVASEITQLTTPQGNVSYEYWNDGQLKKMTNTGTGDTTYAYSSSTGQLTSLTNPFSETTSFVYDSIGRLEKKTFSSGAYELYGYDNRNRIKDIDLKNSSNTVQLAQDYTFDAASNVLTHTKGSSTTTYTYDDINQLVSESRTGYSASYTYDANGNRASKTLGGVTETYTNDSGDKLTEIKIGSTTVKSFSYDAAGRTTGITYSGGTSTLSYDYESRITSISRTGVTTNTFAYNGLDTRISKVDSSGTMTFKRAGAGVTAPVLGDGTATFTPGVSERRGSATTYSHSGLKNVEARSGSGQTVSADRQYDAFGLVVNSSGTWNQFGYAGGFGYQEDADHGLKLLGHRYYDPSTGRFLTRDKVKDGGNWYGYCASNPLNGFDANGLAKVYFGWREVGSTGASHSFILIEDEETGERWTISGGPQGSGLNTGNLVSHSGAHTDKNGNFVTGNYEGKDSGWTSLELIADDDKSGFAWFAWLNGYANRIELFGLKYKTMSQNSNAFVYQILAWAGLIDELMQVLGIPLGGTIKKPSELAGVNPVVWLPGFGTPLP